MGIDYGGAENQPMTRRKIEILPDVDLFWSGLNLDPDQKTYLLNIDFSMPWAGAKTGK